MADANTLISLPLSEGIADMAGPADSFVSSKMAAAPPRLSLVRTTTMVVPESLGKPKLFKVEQIGPCFWTVAALSAVFSDKSSLVAFGCFLFQRRLHGAPPLEFWRYLRCS